MLQHSTPAPSGPPKKAERRYRRGMVTLRELAYFLRAPRADAARLVWSVRTRQLHQTRELFVTRSAAAYYLFLTVPTLDQLVEDGRLSTIQRVEDHRRYPGRGRRAP